MINNNDLNPLKSTRLIGLENYFQDLSKLYDSKKYPLLS